MRTIKNTRNIVVRELFKHLKLNFSKEIPLIPIEELTVKESYPYATYKFTSPYIPFKGEGNFERKLVKSKNEKFKYDVLTTRITQPTMVMSINSYSKSKMEAYEVIKAAIDFFEYTGKQILLDENISVVSVMNSGDRTVGIIDHYEHRMGFDVELRVVDRVIQRKETIETGYFQLENTKINFLKEDENEEFK